MFNMHTSQYYWSATEYSKAIATPIINKFCVNHCTLHCSTDAGQYATAEAQAADINQQPVRGAAAYWSISATDITRYHRDTDR